MGLYAKKIEEATCLEGHAPGEWVTEQQGSACTDKVQKQYCDDCGVLLDTKIEAGSGHTPGEWEAEQGTAVCFDTIYKKKCAVCATVLDVKVEAGQGHVPGEWGAVADGVQKKLCTVCDAVVDVKIVAEASLCADGHTAGEWGTAANGVQKKLCTVCGTIVDVKAVVEADACADGHTAGDWGAAANGVQKKLCTVCGTIVDVKAVAEEDACADGHTAGDWGAAANGVQKKLCTVCGTIVDVKAVVEAGACADGHTAGDWGAAANGVQKKLCTVCGTIVDVKAVAEECACADGHTPGDWVAEAGVAACFDKISKKICTVCSVVLDVKLTPGQGHRLVDSDPYVSKEPTCTDSGEMHIECSTCHTEIFWDSISPLGHSWGEWEVVQPATSTTDGVKKHTCGRCRHEERVTYSGYDAGGFLLDDLPDLDYGGEQIKVMYWSDVENLEFEVESVTGNNVSDAIFDRNNRIEDRLNVDLVWNGVPGNANNRTGFVRMVQSYADAGIGSADIIATYSRTAGTLAVQGLLMDLAKIEDSYIDLEKPWWPSQMVETVSFGNAQGTSYYFLTGDISTNVLHMMHCIYINKDLLNRLDGNINDVYQMVYDGKWTLDALIELTSGVYMDLDGDNYKSNGDRFGFIGRSYVLDAFYIGSNMRYLESGTGAGDALKISNDFGSRKTALLVNKLGAMFAGDDWMTMKFGNEPDYDATLNDISVFQQGRALVIQQHAQVAEKSLVGRAKFSYAILPMPKYSESQVNYYTSVGNPFTLYGLFVGMNSRGNIDNTLTMMSAVLECWASEGYRLTTPEIFEVNMQLKFAEGQDETNMFEYVRAGVTMDMGRILASELSEMCTRVGLCMSSNAPWEAFYGTYKVSLQQKLADVVADFAFYQENRAY